MNEEQEIISLIPDIKQELKHFGANLLVVTQDNELKTLEIIRQINRVLSSEKNQLLFPKLINAVVDKGTGKKKGMMAMAINALPILESIEF